MHLGNLPFVSQSSGATAELHKKQHIRNRLGVELNSGWSSLNVFKYRLLLALSHYNGSNKKLYCILQGNYEQVSIYIQQIRKWN